MNRFLVRLLAPLAPLALAACFGDPTPPVDNFVGFFSVPTYRDAADAPFLTLPTGVFYRAPNFFVSSSHDVPDRCQVERIQQAGGQFPPHANPGDVVNLQLGSQVVTLTPSTSTTTQQTVYQSAQGALQFNPGSDSVIFQIPGASDGFPPMTVRGKTVAPFTGSALPANATLDGFTVTWTPAGDATSAMAITIRYVTGNTGTMDEQISCVVQDDGEYRFQGAQLVGYVNRPPDSPTEMIMTRFRTQLVEEGRYYLHLLMSYRFPVPPSSQASASVAFPN